MMNALRNFAVQLAKRVWFREGTSHRCLIGPYAGLIFEVSSPLQHRMSVFYKSYESEVTGLLQRHLNPGTTFCDVGAHVGIHTLYAVKQLGAKGSVYAFEAWPLNFRCLQRNVRLNEHKKTKVRVTHCAIKEEEGRVRIAQGRSDGTHHLAEEGEDVTVEVEATTLDRFFDKEDTVPDVVLIDVEGAELNVLRGAECLIESNKPQFILEHHDQRNQLSEWLMHRGYKTRPVGERHLYAW